MVRFYMPLFLGVGVEHLCNYAQVKIFISYSRVLKQDAEIIFLPQILAFLILSLQVLVMLLQYCRRVMLLPFYRVSLCLICSAAACMIIIIISRSEYNQAVMA